MVLIEGGDLMVRFSSAGVKPDGPSIPASLKGGRSALSEEETHPILTGRWQSSSGSTVKAAAFTVSVHRLLVAPYLLHTPGS